jgi:hypothetical protein
MASFESLPNPTCYYKHHEYIAGGPDEDWAVLNQPDLYQNGQSTPSPPSSSSSSSSGSASTPNQGGAHQRQSPENRRGLFAKLRRLSGVFSTHKPAGSSHHHDHDVYTSPPPPTFMCATSSCLTCPVLCGAGADHYRGRPALALLRQEDERTLEPEMGRVCQKIKCK